MKYSPNPEVNKTIEELLAKGCSPIPVAPKQDPRKEWCHRVARTKDGASFCPLDKNLDPIPRFTGKNPSYLKPDGSAWICMHGEFQKRRPSTDELKKFFCHPDTGVGTLGGHAGVDWLDFDAKNYESQASCDSDVEGIIARNNLHNTWIERTGSGGWRIAVKPRQKPTFTNFSTSPDGQHVGEALFEGRFTVLAPSIHPNGNAYRRVGWGSPVEVESLEALGIFPSKDEVEQAHRNQQRQKRKASNPHYGRPTNPQDNPWDIRNFAHYFEGYHERSDGWAYAKCPHHNGTSQTSFRVRLDTGEYKLWCGCNTKDVYKSGLALAKSQGYRVPEKDPSITRDEWEVKHGFGKFLKSKLSNIFKGFGTRPEPRTRPLQLRTSGDGLIEFQPGERLRTIAKLRSQGKRVILDRSPTGSGKTHDAGLLYPDEDSKNRTWYLDVNHRNPTTETVERMTDLPPRHNGQVIEAGKLTPLGNPYIRNLRADETPENLEMTPGNCYRANWFATLREKGYNPEQEQGDGRNPICSKCPMYFNCTRGAGDGYGFLSERREALKANRLRAHIESLPQPTEFDCSKDICIVEEAARNVRGTQSIQAGTDEINTFWARLERVAPDAFEALKPYRIILGEALDGDFDVVQNGRNRGANHERLLDNLPSSHLLVPNLPEVIEQVKRAMPSLEELVVEADSVSGVGGKWRAAGDSVRSHFRKQAAAETLANLQNAPTNILVHVLEIWAGLKRGSVRCYNGTLSVVIPDTRHANLLHAFGTVVLMDATGDKTVLAKTLNIDPNDIVEIRQASPKPTNLTVVNVQMPGMGSNQVSDACKQRQENLLNGIYSRHEGQSVKVLANKSDTHLPKDGYWFRDNRGSNEFKGTDVLVAFNTPRPNWGAIEDDYRAIFGSLEGFEEYYQHLIASEIVQLIGRPRANLYPNQQITVYLVSTGLDLEFLKQYGVKLSCVEAFQICPEAGTAAQLTRWKILEATRTITEQGGKLTQEAIAGVTGKSQELISKIAKELGGWKQLKKLLLALLEPYRGGNNFSALSDEERWLAESYLPALLQESPEVAVEELGQMIRAVGFRSFLRMLSAASPRTQARVLGLVFRGLPHSWRETVCVHLN